MKSLLVGLVLTAAALAQTTIMPARATAPLNSTPADSAPVARAGVAQGSSGGNATSISDVPDEKKVKKPIVVPASLLGGGAANADAGLGAAVNTMKNGPDASAPAKPQGLHFDILSDGTDPVSVTVRRFQLFCNGHTMKQDEEEVRQWVKDNQNIVASNPAEMRRKQQYPLVRDKLIELKFPKEWFEGGTGASPVQDSTAASATSK